MKIFGTFLPQSTNGGVKITPATPIGAQLDVRGYAVPSVQSQTLNIVEVSVGVVISF